MTNLQIPQHGQNMAQRITLTPKPVCPAIASGQGAHRYTRTRISTTHSIVAALSACRLTLPLRPPGPSLPPPSLRQRRCPVGDEEVA